jgi:hypothetical protein
VNFDHAAPCPACGQPLVPRELPLPPTKRKILDVVRRRPGIGAADLRDAVWANDPGGGPECRHAIYVHVCQLNRLLAPRGIAVRGGITGGYRIVSTRMESAT